MPLVPFDRLPDDARVWVFAASDALDGQHAATLLREVESYLAQWKAHGEPLTCSRDWREGHFLAVGVDQSTAGASGCSVDALFRILHRLQSTLGTSLVGGGRVFYRDHLGQVKAVDRAALEALAARGEIDERTAVFDTSVTTAATYRTRFEVPASESWLSKLLRVQR
jgi:hypothetical protein